MEDNSPLKQFMMEFGWVGLAITFLVSDLGASAFISFLQGVLEGPEPSLESAFTFGWVFIQTFGLSLGITISVLSFLNGNRNPGAYAFILVLAAALSNAIGATAVPLPTGGSPFGMIGWILEAYLSIYGMALFVASCIIGTFTGRWAYLLSK